ncbi:LEA type 2 family protein [Microbulbifer sp. OS29]|uniref:LEA type 2 family protein n=1 Tax=Microbulbifer okhotskensis TaxID=2926617 RepID=A0A9X2J5Z3_9GAMM|nr:LEA type 2 family protein [Microbulbifer okhotskensis]MCO1335728.1 LEA type 2 family protein [Microbulbifer okhotskensis]
MQTQEEPIAGFTGRQKYQGHSVTNLFHLSLLALISLLIGGCTALSPNFQQPEIEIVGLEPLPSVAGTELRFRIHLRVFNPNNHELALSGLYYKLSLAGHKVMTGTSNNLLPVAPYGQDDISVDATASWMGSLFAAAELINRGQQSVPYELQAKLGLSRSIVPSITVRRSGKVRLGQYQPLYN